jgi:hypothetical protein
MIMSTRARSKAPAAALSLVLAIAGAPSAHAAVCFPAKPLAYTAITSNFGMRHNPDHNGALILHQGIDFRAQSPLEVYAVHSGVVSELNTRTMNVVAVKGDDGITVRYLHMKTNYPKKVGDRVNAGENIGLSGNTGTKAYHLHFEAFPTGASSKVDPKQYFCPDLPIAPGAQLQTTYYPGTGDPGKPVPLQLGGTGGTAAAVPGGPGPGTKLPDGRLKGGDIPPSAPFPDMLGKSVKEFFSEEVNRRFMNPEWLNMLVNPDFRSLNPSYAAAHPTETALKVVDPSLMIIREIAIMFALSNAIAIETSDSRTSTQAMRATMLQMRAEAYSRRVMSTIRSVVTSR